MRYQRAVEKLRILAEECERLKVFPPDDDPFLKAVYTFGDVLDGTDSLEAVQVAVAINLPPEEVPWESNPRGADWLADELRLSKGAYLYFWRSYLDPIWNHYIRGPVRIWSVEGGPDEQALAALEARDFGSLERLVPDPVDERLQLRDDLDAALAHLREIRDKYWDHDWRREHCGYGRYPENELWDAVEGYLDLLDATRPQQAGHLKPSHGQLSLLSQGRQGRASAFALADASRARGIFHAGSMQTMIDNIFLS